MKTSVHLFLCTALCATLGSCASMFTSVVSSAQLIERGMTERNVRGLMGNPHYRRFNGEGEQWEYRSRLINNDMDVVVVSFRDGRVVSMDSFIDRGPALPPPPEKKD